MKPLVSRLVSRWCRASFLCICCILKACQSGYETSGVPPGVAPVSCLLSEHLLHPESLSCLGGLFLLFLTSLLTCHYDSLCLKSTALVAYFCWCTCWLVCSLLGWLGVSWPSQSSFGLASLGTLWTLLSFLVGDMLGLPEPGQYLGRRV